MKFEEIVALAEAARVDALARESNLPPADRNLAAMASALRVAAARLPVVAKYLESHRPATVVDEVDARRQRERALPTIVGVAAQASADSGGDVTPELLTGPAAYPWLVEWRDLCWWKLSRTGMFTRQIGPLFGRSYVAVANWIRRQEARERAKESVANQEARREAK